MWLRRDTGEMWSKVVVDVMVTSTDDMNNASKEKNEKYRAWATSDTPRKQGDDGGDGASSLSLMMELSTRTLKEDGRTSLTISMSTGFR